MKRLLAVLLAVCFVATLFVGCGSQEPAKQADVQKEEPKKEEPKKEEAKKEEPKKEAPKTMSATEATQQARALAEKVTSGGAGEFSGDPVIACVMPSLDHEGWLGMLTGTVLGATKLGAGMQVYSANNDVQKQMSIIEDLIVKKVKGIIFVPVDSTALSAAVEKCNAANIPIVALDRSTTGGKVTALVTSDNTACGTEAAKELAKLANGKELKVFNLQGDLATSAGLERNNGFKEELKKYPNIKIVAEIAGNWQPEKGNSATLDAFQANPDINAIYLPSELYAQGVTSALEQLKKLKPVGDKDHIIIVGIDGQPIGHEQIRKDIQDVSVAQQLFVMGTTAMDALVKSVKGEKVEKDNVLIPPVVVTKANVDDENHWGVQFATKK